MKENIIIVELNWYICNGREKFHLKVRE